MDEAGKRKFKYFSVKAFRENVKFLLAIIFLLLSVFLYFAYSPSSNFYGHVVSHVNTQNKIVALTFDDGPNGKATLQILSILQKENIHATFFLVGDNVNYYPSVAKQIVADGNEIGNHSMHHDRLTPLNDEADIKTDLLAANNAIKNATGVTPIYFRPPHGFRTPWGIRAAQKAGFVVVTWNDLTTDYKALTAEQVKKNIESKAKPGGIIVLHDGFGVIHGANRDQMIKALPQIIEDLKAQGYTFVTVSQLLDQK